MLKFLYPKLYLPSVYELTAEKLKSLNINTVIFDIDNTLVPYWVKTPDEKLKAYFQSLIDAGITVSVLSNSREERSRIFCSEMNLSYVYRAGKPGTKGMRKLLKKLGASPEHSLIAGDQIFTDVWCGNKSGVFSVLIKQITLKDELITLPKRPFEKIVLLFYKLYLKRGKTR